MPPSRASLPSPRPHLYVVTEHRAGLLVLYSNFSSAGYFMHDGVYVDATFSVGPTLSISTVCTSPFSISASPFLP